MIIGNVGGSPQQAMEKRSGRIEAMQVAVAGAGLP
jgi:hypothetical protein